MSFCKITKFKKTLQIKGKKLEYELYSYSLPGISSQNNINHEKYTLRRMNI